MEKLSVGQVVFLFVRKEQSIIPVQVVEEVVHRKLAGEEIRYFVRASTEADAKVHQLDIKKQMIFKSVAEARQFMIENATQAINEICAEAEDFSKNFLPKSAETPLLEEKEADSDPIENTAQPSQQGAVKVRLPNGELVNVVI